jgi:hypothetical protein
MVIVEVFSFSHHVVGDARCATIRLRLNQTRSAPHSFADFGALLGNGLGIFGEKKF